MANRNIRFSLNHRMSTKNLYTQLHTNNFYFKIKAWASIETKALLMSWISSLHRQSRSGQGKRQSNHPHRTPPDATWFILYRKRSLLSSKRVSTDDLYARSLAIHWEFNSKAVRFAYVTTARCVTHKGTMMQLPIVLVRLLFKRAK